MQESRRTLTLALALSLSVLVCVGVQASIAFDALNYKLKPPNCSMAQIEERLKKNPNDSGALCDRAQAFLTAGECELAVADYGSVIKHNPRMAAAYIGRSRANEMIGNHGAALLDINAAIKIGDKSCLADALLHKIAVLSALNRGLDCPAIFEQLINSKDLGVGPADRANLLQQRSELYLRMKKPELAIKDTETCLLARPTSLTCYLNQGKAYAQLKQPQKELAAYCRGIKLDNGKLRLSYRRVISELYVARAKLYESMGKSSLAKADLLKARAEESDVYQDVYSPTK
ncbi:hypothetical protein BH11CYA1_BH11CYA1_44190 [soil metagenome]